MLKKLFLVLLSLSLIFFAACSEESSTEPEPQVNEFNLVAAIGDEYYTDYTTTGGLGVNISIGDVFINLTDGNDTNNPYIIDYRSATDFASGHLIGAINMALGDLMTNLSTLPTDKVILNVCYSGQTASVATAALNMLGYESQNLLFGMCSVTADPNVISGTDKWATQIAADEYTMNMTAVPDPTTEYDFPEISTGKKTGEEILKEQFVNTASGWGIAFADVIANPTNYFIINYWSKTDYDNIGHIEGAYQFTPNVAFQKDEMLKNLPTDKTIVVYCWTGQTSAQVTAYLRMLGYDAKSLLYGVNGFCYNALPSHKYVIPSADYSSIITP